MHKLCKFIGFSASALGAVLILGRADAAESGRAAYNVTNVNSRVGSVSTQRMPTMPTLPGSSIGNISPSLPSDNNNGGDKPKPPIVQDCPDGGIKNSEYTVDQCMNDVLACVNNGALPGGLNDLFNEDLRNAIVNGMGLCTIQVEKCVTTVRKDCANVYNASSDVWIDFNSRKVQPEYYSFVLRKTGLTPNQAENTCWLLDKNTYGSSFAAVSNDGAVTAEYANRVAAYNNQAGSGAQKASPQGVKINNNNTGVDGQRGHYARWDATTATCLIRVAAYNKDSHIKNSWLFGGAGDDKPAEVWKAAGDTFSCNKDLFGFSLLNQTSTAAVVGVAGGTVVGAGVGAIAGHGKREFDCTNKSQLKDFSEQLRKTGGVGVLNEHLESQLSASGGVITEQQCREIIDLYSIYQLAKSADKTCNGSSSSSKITRQTVATVYKVDFQQDAQGNIIDYGQIMVGDKLVKIIEPTAEEKAILEDTGPFNAISARFVDVDVEQSDDAVDGCPTFHRLNKAKEQGTGIYCTGQTGCISGAELDKEVKRLGNVLEAINILDGQDSNMVKSTLIGAGVGAATGGLATAITAFVEKNNINCRVGDDLERISLGKSHHIGSLKDFYVKWNLRLPDTIMPTALVIDCASWKAACGTLTDLKQCVNAKINYKPVGAITTKLVDSACLASGSACIENYSVAKSYGACK